MGVPTLYAVHRLLHSHGLLEERPDGRLERHGRVGLVGCVRDEVVRTGRQDSSPGQAWPGFPHPELVHDRVAVEPYLHAVPADHGPARVEADLRGRATRIHARVGLSAGPAPGHDSDLRELCLGSALPLSCYS